MPCEYHTHCLHGDRDAEENLSEAELARARASLEVERLRAERDRLREALLAALDEIDSYGPRPGWADRARDLLR